ncbi:aldo/keto reductase [Intrasporangium calvum]|uniref:Aldo/keto reductase n=1 Tax=Intrasporangium calvum TaxID=53358 RepID=A0ABT5GHA5_9MICO|nr:aldo/keto reductase [Intrasporangium calvum]MDC5697517.1 aldo/keto reductase [Intrasporangium calvum]
MQSPPPPARPDLELPRLGLGAMTFGDQVDLAGARALVQQALESGVVMIDTANVYAGGRSEPMVGEVIAGFRDRLVLATKVGIPTDEGDRRPLAAVRIQAELENSLRRLGTDHIDLYYLHQPDRSTPVEETLAAVGDLITQGKIRAWGVSNFASWQISEMRHVAQGLGIPHPLCAQQQYNLLSRRLEDEYAEFARTVGLGTVVYNPLAGGMLTGKHLGSAEPAEGRFASAMYKERYWNAQIHAAVRRLAELAGELGISLVQLAFRWLLGGTVTTSVLLGASRPEHLAENLAAVTDEPLPSQALEVCDSVWAVLRGAAPAYNR